ncbi:MAG: formate dehydrogenase ferredoxin subunit [Candidatus Poribacteria bacterium]|nr:formate dehydrogenase ferredoxin subunit [Candidatus Poribacteria bacterium]
MTEIASLTPPFGGITYDRLDNGGIQFPCPNKEHPGTQYLFKDKFPIGRGQFQGFEYLSPNEMPDEEYPFILSTGRTLYHWHTGTVTGRAKALDAIVPKGYVEIHPIDAKSLDVADGDEVKVTSRRGEITISAKVSDIVFEGTVFMPFAFRESAANVLTNPELNPQAKNAALKVCAVRIAKA